MSQIIGEFRIGEDVSVAFAPQTTPAASITLLAVSLVAAIQLGGDFVIQDNTGSLALTIATMAAQGNIPAGWIFTLPAASSGTLTPGVYAIDAKFQIGAAIEKTGASAFVRLSRAAL